MLLVMLTDGMVLFTGLGGGYLVEVSRQHNNLQMIGSDGTLSAVVYLLVPESLIAHVSVVAVLKLTSFTELTFGREQENSFLTSWVGCVESS